MTLAKAVEVPGVFLVGVSPTYPPLCPRCGLKSLDSYLIISVSPRKKVFCSNPYILGHIQMTNTKVSARRIGYNCLHIPLCMESQSM